MCRSLFNEENEIMRRQKTRARPLNKDAKARARSSRIPFFSLNFDTFNKILTLVIKVFTAPICTQLFT